MPNPYLTGLREQYEAIRSSIEGVQTRAVEAKRNLTEEELRSVKGQADQAKALAAEIESLTEIETRNAKVGQLAASIVEGQEDEQNRTGGKNGVTGAQNRSANGQGGALTRANGVGYERLTGNASTRERDPGHYRSVEDGGRNGFFADSYRAKYRGDAAAATRLTEYARAMLDAGYSTTRDVDSGMRAALTSADAGAGLVTPHWLTERFQYINYQKRAFANQVVNIPLDGDSRPMTLPMEDAGADGAVGDQAAEGDAPADSNTYDTTTDTITPKPTFGEQVVSRQFLEFGTPAGDFLIYKNLSAVYDSKIEAKVCAAAIAAAASNAVTIPSDLPDDPAAGDSFREAGVASDAVIDTTVLIDSTRFVSPSLVVVTPQRWGKFRKLRDDQGRPLMPVSSYGPQNAQGLATGLMAGEFEGLTVLKTTGMGTGTSFPEKFLVVVPDDIWLFEDNEMQYRYEEKGGPEKITIGIWRYNAVKVVQGGKGVRTVTVTASAHA